MARPDTDDRQGPWAAEPARISRRQNRLNVFADRAQLNSCASVQCQCDSGGTRLIRQLGPSAGILLLRVHILVGDWTLARHHVDGATLAEMPAVVNILSYFSLATDLAVALSSWPEYRDGHEYDVTLYSIDGAEEVTTRLLHAEENGTPYVRVASSSGGALFERVLGRVVFELAAHSDDLTVTRHSF